MKVGPQRRLRAEELTLSKCGTGEDSLESPLDCKEIKPVSPKGNQPWILIGRTDAEAETPVILVIWCEQLTHWKSPWCWERLRAEGEGGDRGWDGWMASPTHMNLSKFWEISKEGKPGMLQFMGLQSVRQDLVTEQQGSHHPRTFLINMYSACPWPQRAVSGALNARLKDKRFTPCN